MQASRVEEVGGPRLSIITRFSSQISSTPFSFPGEEGVRSIGEARSVSAP